MEYDKPLIDLNLLSDINTNEELENFMLRFLPQKRSIK